MGFIALFFVILSFQSKGRDKILFFQFFSSIFYFLNLFLIGALTGAITMMFGIFRNYVFLHKGKKNWASHPVWLFLFLGIFIISGILTYKNVFSILPIAGMCLGTICFWMTNPSYIRWIAALTPPLWITYDYVSGSIAGIILEVIYFIAVITGIIRFDILKQTEK